MLATAFPLAGVSAPAEVSSPLATTSNDNVEQYDSKGDRYAPLSLIVNGVAKSDAIVVLRGSDVFVSQSDLARAQVPIPGAVFVDVAGVHYVSLASLAPNITFRIDLVALALDVFVGPSLLGHSDIRVGQDGSSRHLAEADPSGFLTYSVSSATANLRDASGFVQAGAGSERAGLFTASGSYSDGTTHRGLFAFQKESEQRLSRLTIGDENASTGDLGANVVVGGFGATRHFEFQPDYAYFPTPGLRGTALSPTSADLYVNGAFVRSVQLAPGNFDLSDIAVPAGAGVTQVILRDSYGNSQTLSGTYYQTRQLLRKGLTDYDYHVGFLRPNPFGRQDAYGALAALGEYRLGLSDKVTVGARFERTTGITSGGPQLDLGSRFGHVSFETALSSAGGRTGHALGAAYEYYARSFGIGFSAETQSENYSTASLLSYAPRQRSSVRENFGIPISRFASLNISNMTTTYSDLPTGGQLLANLILRPTRGRVVVLVSAERDGGGSVLGIGNSVLGVGDTLAGAAVPAFGYNGANSSARWTFGAQLSLQTGRNSNLSVGMSDTAGVGSETVALSQTPPTGPGFGYQIQGTTGAYGSAAAQVAYQTQFANLDAYTNSSSGPATTSVTLAGAVVAFRQGAFFTQPVNGAYTLIDVPGFARLPAFFNGQYAGRTDRRDKMVVPNLSPYYDNVVGIDDLRDRLDLTEDASTQLVRPKNLSGAVSVFNIHHFHAFAGHIIVHRGGKAIVPVLGQVVFNSAGIDYQSDLGREGQFYVENLEPGKFGATVTTADGLTCVFKVVLVADANPVTTVGTLECKSAL